MERLNIPLYPCSEVTDASVAAAQSAVSISYALSDRIKSLELYVDGEPSLIFDTPTASAGVLARDACLQFIRQARELGAIPPEIEIVAARTGVLMDEHKSAIDRI